jgi:putative heme iron utilization protein
MVLGMTNEGTEAGEGLRGENGPQNESLGAEARGLVRRAIKASLATVGSAHESSIEAKFDGWPANALVTVAAACDGAPILLLSTLAYHTRNLLADSRASLLIEDTGRFANPQAGPRVSVVGRIVRNDDPAVARRFVARHPAARAYAGFGDFAFYSMDVARLHSVGGFARARWIECENAVLDTTQCREIADAEDDILQHMNTDHANTVLLYAQRFLNAKAKRAKVIAVDPEGFDLRVGRTLGRIDFPRAVKSLDQIRAAFVDLAQRARAAS